jgi:hypothetical protein
MQTTEGNGADTTHPFQADIVSKVMEKASFINEHEPIFFNTICQGSYIMASDKEKIATLSLLQYIFFVGLLRWGIVLSLIITFVRFMFWFTLTGEEILVYLISSSYITCIYSGHKWLYYRQFPKEENDKGNIMKYTKNAFIKGFIFFGIPVTFIVRLIEYLQTNEPISIHRIIVGYIFISYGSSLIASIPWHNIPWRRK